MQILIGMPSGSGQVPIQMVQSLLQLHKPAPCGFMSVERQRMDKARNIITMEAIRGNFDYLFFVDDDNPIPPDTLEKFLEDDKDIVIAPILTRNADVNGDRKLCAFYSSQVKTSIGKVKLYENITTFKDEGYLHQIAAGGTGCMLIKRKVLVKLSEVYQDSIFEFGDLRFDKIKVKGIEYDRRTMSEDAEFCERATKAGFEIWLDDRIKPIHLTAPGGVQYA